jgi:uncharacterized membrane protein YvlD (DUF360 family)
MTLPVPLLVKVSLNIMTLPVTLLVKGFFRHYDNSSSIISEDGLPLEEAPHLE